MKKTWSKPCGAMLTRREAASNAFGWPIWKVPAKSSSAACFWIASTMLRAAVAGVHAPETGRAVQHLAAVLGEVVHVLGRGEQARRALELPVRRERHQEGARGRWS